MPRNRLLVIGLDGFEPSFADGLMRQGRLPTLARLHARSAGFHLNHGPDKRTGLAWEHFSTGLRPAASSRWSAVDFDSVHYHCRTRLTDLRPFAADLAAKTVVFDTPYLDLSAAPNLEGIIDWGAHDPGSAATSRPSSLHDEVRRRFGDYPAKPWIYGFTWPSPARTEQMGEGLRRATHRRADIARWLFAERIPDWTLAMMVVSELHSASEALWHGVDPRHPLHGLPSAPLARKGMEESYEAVDDLLATMTTSFPDADLLVFSMHGMGPNESDVASMALLPELMYRRRFGQPHLRASHNRQLAAGVPSIDANGNWSLHARELFEPEAPRWRQGLKALKARIPQPAKDQLKKLFGLDSGVSPSRSPGELAPLDWMPSTWYEPFWPDMDAFAFPSFYDGQVRLNLVGREARGRIEVADSERVCDELIEELSACTNPQTGRPIVREIIRSSRRSPLELGPTEADITVVWDGAPLALQHPKLGTIGPLPYRRSGGHTGSHGIALLSGPQVEPGFRGQRSAFDVAPTIVHWISGAESDTLSGTSFADDVRRRATPVAS